MTLIIAALLLGASMVGGRDLQGVDFPRNCANYWKADLASQGNQPSWPELLFQYQPWLVSRCVHAQKESGTDRLFLRLWVQTRCCTILSWR